uniref:KIB1-4 beta-propeller domain-containing protein n=1 Tax=Brassica oleracea var. oleracea TaxID=109376 RepID=A0A0D3DMY4_BRAOL
MSSLMFSKEDNRFYIPSRGGNYLCYLVEKQEKLEVMDLKFDEFPASVYEEVAKLSSLSRTDHLVESPTGQLFLVKWYGEDSEVWMDSEKDDENEGSTLKHVTKKFMVYRAGVQSGYYEKTMIHTEDIGDLCIFLGHSQAFCVPVSSSPGLKPNCIYFVGRNFGVYDLTTKTCTAFSTQYDGPVRRSKFPYWPL